MKYRKTLTAGLLSLAAYGVLAASPAQAASTSFYYSTGGYAPAPVAYYPPVYRHTYRTYHPTGYWVPVAQPVTYYQPYPAFSFSYRDYDSYNRGRGHNWRDDRGRGHDHGRDHGRGHGRH